MQSGAVGAVSEKIAIATGVTNHNSKPMVTAGYATMQSLTGGRFVLGLDGGSRMQDAFGLGRITAQMEDFAESCAVSSWQAIIGHDGPAGSTPCSTSTPVSMSTSR